MIIGTDEKVTGMVKLLLLERKQLVEVLRIATLHNLVISLVKLLLMVGIRVRRRACMLVCEVIELRRLLKSWIVGRRRRRIRIHPMAVSSIFSSISVSLDLTEPQLAIAVANQMISFPPMVSHWW